MVEHLKKIVGDPQISVEVALTKRIVLKWLLSKLNYKPILDVPFNLMHLHRIPENVKALQTMFWCPYSVAYSPYKSYNWNE